MATIEFKHAERLIKRIPSRMDDLEIVNFLNRTEFDFKYLLVIKKMSKMTDKLMADLLDVSERRLRDFKSYKVNIERRSIKEKTILLLTLLKHGRMVFGDDESFRIWLNKENLTLGGKKPISFLNSNAGMNFIDDRLTGMEYGDNL